MLGLVFSTTNSIAASLPSLASLWSNEFSPPTPLFQEESAPPIWGISWLGTVARNDNEDHLFSLASVKKMITAATALRVLGPDFKFANEFNGELDASQGIIFSPSFKT